VCAQGQWEKDSPLLQLPHVTPQLAAAAAAQGVSTVFDLIEMEDSDRQELLQVRWCAGGRSPRACALYVCCAAALLLAWARCACPLSLARGRACAL
jgi:hypothetical protein